MLLLILHSKKCWVVLTQFGQIWTNPNVGLKCYLKNVTQWLGLSIFDPKFS